MITKIAKTSNRKSRIMNLLLGKPCKSDTMCQKGLASAFVNSTQWAGCDCEIIIQKADAKQKKEVRKGKKTWKMK